LQRWKEDKNKNGGKRKFAIAITEQKRKNSLQRKPLQATIKKNTYYNNARKLSLMQTKSFDENSKIFICKFKNSN